MTEQAINCFTNVHDAIIRQFVTQLIRSIILVRYSCNLSTLIEYWQSSILIKILSSCQKQCAHISALIIVCKDSPWVVNCHTRQLVTDQTLLYRGYFTISQLFIPVFSTVLTTEPPNSFCWIQSNKNVNLTTYNRI